MLQASWYRVEQWHSVSIVELHMSVGGKTFQAIHQDVQITTQGN